MKKLVFQVDIVPDKIIGNHHTVADAGKGVKINNEDRALQEELIVKCKASMKAYADKIGADYMLITEQKDARHPCCERYRAFEEEAFDSYDKILYADIDVLVNDDSADILDLITVDQFAYCQRPDFGEATGYDLNSGVLAFGKNVRSWFHENLDLAAAETHRFRDQEEIKLKLPKAVADGIDVKMLHYTWNDYEYHPQSHFHHFKSGLWRKIKFR